MAKTKVKLSKDEKSMLFKSFLYSCGTFVGGNQIVQQGKCFAMSLLPGLKLWYKDKPEEKDEIFAAHAGEYFNTNATCEGLCVGVAMAMEKERAEKGTIDQGAISSVKASLMGPTAAIGDSLLFNILRTIVAGICISLAADGSFLAPILFIVLFGGIRLVLNYVGLYYGYTRGIRFVESAFSSGILPLVTEVAGIVGAMMIGVLVASNVKFSLALGTSVGELEVTVQGVLDSIAPGILSLGIWYGSFKMLQKGLTPTKLIFLIMGACVILSLFGIV